MGKALAVLILSALAGAIFYWNNRPGVSDAYLKRYGSLFQSNYDEANSFMDPLCVPAGPFPLDTRNKARSCDRCADLVSAGLLTQESIQEGERTYTVLKLTAAGRPFYTEDADPEVLAIVKKRLVEQGKANQQPDAKRLASPRFCFGKKRFHHLEDALSPLNGSDGTRYLSAKVVAEAKDLDPIVWDPKLADLKLEPPPPPEPGKPALYKAEVITLHLMPDGKSAEIDSVRYGAWVNEK